MEKIVTEYLTKTAIRYPDKIAFEDEKRKMTYVQLQQEAYHAAYYFIKHGIIRKPVAVFMEKNIECIACFFGIAYSSNFYTVVDINAPIQRVQNILNNLQPAIIVTNEKNREKIETLENRAEIILYEEFVKEDFDMVLITDRISQIKGSDILFVMYTSGSTGTPKGVVISHRAVIEYTEAASHNYPNISDRNVFGNQYPFYYIASIDDIFLPVRNGGSTVIIPSSFFYSPSKLVQYLIDKHINVINWVPSALAIVANYDALSEKKPQEIDMIIFGGESISIDVLAYWKKALPNVVLMNGYGATETTNGTTYCVIDNMDLESGMIPLGNSLDNVEIILVDYEGKEVEQGKVGEMYVRTTALSNGYYKDIEKTKTVFVQNPVNILYRDIVYKTGDLARQDEFGRYIYVGRVDNQVKINGNRVELGDIENNALQIKGVDQCVCIYNKQKKRLLLYYVGVVSTKEIYESMRKSLPVFMVPSDFYKVKEFPLNANGKIDRMKLGIELEEK